jgi:hypothetical protein
MVVLYCCLSVMIGGDDILEGLRDRWWRRVLERGLEGSKSS